MKELSLEIDELTKMVKSLQLTVHELISKIYVKNDTLNKKDGKKSKHFKCKESKEEFRYKINFSTHINKYHPRKIECSICYFEGLILRDIDEHMLKSHSSERKFKCNKCESTFMSEI